MMRREEDKRKSNLKKHRKKFKTYQSPSFLKSHKKSITIGSFRISKSYAHTMN